MSCDSGSLCTYFRSINEPVISAVLYVLGQLAAFVIKEDDIYVITFILSTAILN
jgi:hypothetical protein